MEKRFSKIFQKSSVNFEFPGRYLPMEPVMALVEVRTENITSSKGGMITTGRCV